METLLRVEHLSKTFPGIRALHDVGFSIHSGEVTALVGQNGSGKSTLVKVLAGIHDPDSGAEITLQQRSDGRQPQLHFIHQDLGLVATMSTIENLSLNRTLGRRGLKPNPVRHEAGRAQDLIARFGADFDVRRPVGKLRPAERTIVAIARALRDWTHPHHVLVLDEPTASLHRDEVQVLFHAVRQVAQRGAGVVFISHRLDEVIELADRLLALRDGRLMADVGRGEFDHDDLVSLITGTIQKSHAGRTVSPDGPVQLRATQINGTSIRALDVEVKAGEILGVSGVLGSGREELSAILFGAAHGQVGEFVVNGKLIAQPTPRRCIAAGIAYVPSDRPREGAVMTMSARENMTLPRLAPLRRRWSGSIDAKGEHAEVDHWTTRVALAPPDAERALQLFSGGNQQKVILAKWLRNDPTVLLLDEPTQGVDVGAKAAIYELIAAVAAAGASVLVCSSDAKELAMICHRVVVLRDGRAVAELSHQELSEAALVRAEIGSGAGLMRALGTRTEKVVDS